MASPVLSIITVSFNAERFIARTVESVLKQTWPGIEYIVVDGGSTDRTPKILDRYRDRIARVISEKDRGIYDAMNKGMKLATGDYLLFLNADDELNDDTVVEEIFAGEKDADVYYGEAVFMDKDGHETGLRSVRTPHKVPERLDWTSLRYGMVVSHQAFVIKRTLAVEYNLEYQVCADIDWMIRCLKNCRSACNTRLIISKFRTGGTSKQKQKRAWVERYLILQKYYGALPNFFNHCYIALRYIFSRKY